MRLTAASTLPPSRIEDALRLLPGVTQARLNSITGNVLIHFDPHHINQETILAAIAFLEGEPMDCPPELPLPSGSDSASANEGPSLAARLLKTASRIADRKLAVSLRGPASVVAAVPLLQESPLVNEKLGRLLGGNVRDVLLSLASILANLLTASPLRIALASVEAILLLRTLFDSGKEANVSAPIGLSLQRRAA